MTSGLLMRPCPPTKKNDEHALDGLHRAYQVNCLDGTVVNVYEYKGDPCVR